MINLGNVVADSTIRIPFNTFDADGASTTISNFSAADDIKVYKDNSTTTRASTSGYTITTDLGGDGIQAVNIDLSDNADPGYYEVGSTYDVAVNMITIDGETVRFWVAKFEIQSAASVGASNRQSGFYHFFEDGTLSVPSWAKSAWVGAVGGGGGGRGSTAPHGGGGGGYAEGNLDVASGETLTVTIGAGGVLGGASVDGSDTTISGSTTGTLVTGGGGTQTGGSGTGGDYQATGGNGGLAATTSSGGGGGAGTAHGDGGNGGNGAVSTRGGGGGGAGGDGAASNSFAAGGGGGFKANATDFSGAPSILGALGTNSTDAIAGGVPLTHMLPFGDLQTRAGCGGQGQTSTSGSGPGGYMAGGGGGAPSPSNGGLFGGGGGTGGTTSGAKGGDGGRGAGGGGAHSSTSGPGRGGDGYAFVQFFG